MSSHFAIFEKKKPKPHNILEHFRKCCKNQRQRRAKRDLKTSCNGKSATSRANLNYGSVPWLLWKKKPKLFQSECAQLQPPAFGSHVPPSIKETAAITHLSLLDVINSPSFCFVKLNTLHIQNREDAECLKIASDAVFWIRTIIFST